MDRLLRTGLLVTKPSQNTCKHKAKLFGLERAHLSNCSDVRICRDALYDKRTRLEERNFDRDFESRSSKAGGVWNDGDQRAIRVSEVHADYQGRSYFLRHPEIEEPDLSPAWGHSPASN